MFTPCAVDNSKHESLRKYLRIVFRDKPVRRSISRVRISSRKLQRLIAFNSAGAA
jgi:hypothetical protein